MAIRCAALGAAEASRLAAAGPSAADPSATARGRPGAAMAALARPGTNSGTAPIGTDLHAAGVRLTARLHLEEPARGLRPLHPCLRPECGCLGVYYTCFGGGASEIRVTVALEAAPAGAAPSSASCAAAGAAASASSSSSSSASPRSAVPAAVAAAFAATPPSLGLFHNACGQPGLTSGHQPITPTRSAYDPAAEAWHVWYRPRRTTGDHLAQVVARWGGQNTVMSGGFEVRTKPHKWVLLQGLPAAADEAAVEAFLSRCHPALEAPIVTVVRPETPAGAPADASLPHAFVQLKNRSAAHDVMKGYRALSAAATGGVVLSFLAGLSRAAAEDPSLRSVAVPTPSLACPAFVQQALGVERSTSQDTVEAPPSRAGKRCRDEDDEGDEDEDHCSCAAKRAASPGSQCSSTPSELSLGSDASSAGSCSSPSLALAGPGHRALLPPPILPVAMPRWRPAALLEAASPFAAPRGCSLDDLEDWDLGMFCDLTDA